MRCGNVWTREVRRLADVIIGNVQRVKAMKEGENKRFVEFVDLVDNGYKNLLRMGLKKEIMTTSSVSIIEKKLPAQIRKYWAKLVSSDTSSVNKKDKFPSLLKFLRNQKRAIEYEFRASQSHSLAVHHARPGDITEKEHRFENRANGSSMIKGVLGQPNFSPQTNAIQKTQTFCSFFPDNSNLFHSSNLTQPIYLC